MKFFIGKNYRIPDHLINFTVIPLIKSIKCLIMPVFNNNAMVSWN